ncbi:MAG: VOC family protein [Acidimicrobiales bacterium]|nr:VOC family protein [Acidimicrobiales bacterium]
MALNGLLDIELRVPDPAELGDFWERRGMQRSADGVYGTVDRPVQLRIAEGDHRHLAELHLSCAEEADLAAIAARLDTLGVAATTADTTLTCTDPVLGHTVVIDVGAPAPLTPVPVRPANRPGEQGRTTARAGAVDERHTPRAPRRLGHVVLGTPDPEASVRFYLDGLGFKISDSVLNGFATFARIEADHHNLLIHPAPTGYLNHYAMEVDDVDAVGAAGTAVVAERPDASVVGIGRHNLGSNVFWYLTDPAGNTFEFFTDMDQIVDDDAWERDHCRRDWEGSDGPAGFSVWGPTDPPPEFFAPTDLDAIAAARATRGLV